MKSLLLLSAVLAVSAAAPKPRQAPDILAGCGEVKDCWGFYTEGSGPSTIERDCALGQEDCVVIVTWVDNMDGTLNFEVQANNPGSEIGDVANNWVAVGFSRDALMGEDTVIMSSGGLEPPSSLWWNQQSHSGPVYVGDDSGVQNLDIQGGDGFIYAAFNRAATLSYVAPTEDGPADEVNDLALEPFFLLASSGPLAENPVSGEIEPSKHDVRGFSENPFAFVPPPAL